MFGSFGEPLCGFRIVFIYSSVSKIIEPPELKLGLSKVLFGRFAIPFHGFDSILLQAEAAFVK